MLLSFLLGAPLRGGRFDRRKALLLILIIVGFITGGVTGALFYAQLQFYALTAPALICFALALLYHFYLA
ncbi:hypothetical protein [Marinobacterium sedimentorum]|uniref:hypothetical protein n=1 Tax=Marinobacterium sedimentorum TaxID=2927804 RepID=UPI0020C62762|nr:hypothetical protein [Marinobacterium sedimentorum]MCP8688224.1 hypothetical protein [Marinobacterium sedimentorum]